MCITIYKPDSSEYAALKAAAAMLSAMSPRKTRYEVGDIYFDFGQDWMWTTIVAKAADGREWQALCPRDHELITLGGVYCDLDKIVEGVKNVLNSKFNPDRIKEEK